MAFSIETPDRAIATTTLLPRDRYSPVRVSMRQNLARVDEQRYAHHRAVSSFAGLDRRWPVRRARPGRLDHFEFHVRGRRYLQRHAVPQRDHANGAIFEPLGAVADRALEAASCSKVSGT